MPKIEDKPTDILEENRLDNTARTKDHNWDPDKPARPKKLPVVEKVDYDEKLICWYIVIWRNKNVRSRKVGSIFGTEAGITGRRRVVYNKKTHDFEIAEKYALIGKMKGKDFREYMNGVRV